MVVNTHPNAPDQQIAKMSAFTKILTVDDDQTISTA